MITLETAVAAPVSDTYTYLLPQSLEVTYREKPGCLIGRRVFVPFGSRRITGYIFAARRECDIQIELKEIIEILDDIPLFHPSIIPVFRWIAHYYHYPIGAVVKTALPSGLTVNQRKNICLKDEKILQTVLDELQQTAEDHWMVRVLEKKMLSAKETKAIWDRPADRRTVLALVKKGAITVRDGKGTARVARKHEPCYRLAAPYGREVSATERDDECGLKELTKGEQKTVALIRSLAEGCPEATVSRRELLKHYPYAARLVHRLIGKNVIEAEYKRIYRTPDGELLPFLPKPDRLTDEQYQAIHHIHLGIEEEQFKVILLQGVTGSGKTEVYLEAAAKALNDGTGVIVLVPEIALATQIEAHFVSRFGDTVALLHSGLKPGERYDEWSRIYDGDARVVIGARSAIFAPVEKLGLIIVDEEHDSSFKQEDKLRYNSRDIAVIRAREEQSIAVLGSATPAVASYHNAKTKKFDLLEMKNRVSGKKLPKVTLIDLKKDKPPPGKVLHPDFAQAIKDTFNRQEQSILLINRRGFSASVICRDCGSLVECSHCKVTMNLHKGKKQLLCHYCGYRLPEKILCNSCGSGNMVPIGFGTERVEQEVKEMIPEAIVARVDSDSAADRQLFLETLQNIRRRAVDIVVGTQIIAKGLHFPDVTLVGVVWADGGLAFPDYRAAEKTYQLIAQVTGRAGRGERDGRVIIQTMQPHHYAIGYAANHSYEKLAERELDIRKRAGFPPFSRLVSIRVEGEQESDVRKKATEISSWARTWCLKRPAAALTEVLGPAPAPIEKIRDRYRWQILIKGKNIQELHELVGQLALSFRKNGSEKIIIDVDPESML